ncbi:MAG TPA: ABC transporter permease [Gemmatimonadaceae bacterium]|nr:ABC transporter permease [Gemmatimonadaceae bacterium]
MTGFAVELRTAARGLARTPGMALSAVLCIALGVGGTTAVASAISRALLQPLPVRDGDRLVAVHRITPQSGPEGTWPESPANYADLARQSRTVDSLSAITFGTALVNLGSETVQASELIVTGGLFPMLGARAQIGRLITQADDRLDAPLTAVLSDEFWRSKFGADPGIVGRTVDIDGSPTTIVGVTLPRFRIPHGGRVLSGDVWIPIRFTPKRLAQRGNNSLLMLGRLTRGATPASAQAELRGLFAGLVKQYPQLKGENLRVAPLVAEGAQAVRQPLLLLFGAVCMVLLIAATNVAALLLARGVHRQREMAVRTALGATRWHVMRPALVESMLIGVVGTLAGFAVAIAGVKTIGALAAARMPQLAGLTIDGRVIAFGIAVAVVVSLACGGAPAWRNAAIDPQDALRGGRGGGSGREHHRALRGLVVSEIALSLVLLIGAGLMLRAFAGLLGKDPGFETTHVLTLDVTVASARYPNGTSVRRFLDPALDAVRRVPGVQSAGSINLLPYVDWGWNSNIRYEGMPADDPTRMPLVEQRRATPGFFAVTGQRLIAGRLLGPGDDDSPAAPAVVVVNQALAKRDFKGANPVGRRFYYTDSAMATIVGVVSDIRNVGPVADPAPEMYWTYYQAGGGDSRFPIMVRTRGNPIDVAAGVRRAIRAADPTAAVSDIAAMPDVITHSLGKTRFYLLMLGAFAAVALVLTIAGLYGVLSYAVAQRTREMGIRVALGSTQRRLVALVTREGVVLVVTGVIMGLAASFALTRVMASLLYGVSPLDPLTWTLGALSLFVPTVLATVVPALRASRADPIVAMRAE